MKAFEEIEITTAKRMLWFSLFIFYSEIGLEAPGQVITPNNLLEMTLRRPTMPGSGGDTSWIANLTHK